MYMILARSMTAEAARRIRSVSYINIHKKCDESSKLPGTKIVKKSKYNKAKLRYL